MPATPHRHDHSTDSAGVQPGSGSVAASNRNRPYQRCPNCFAIQWRSAKDRWWYCGRCGADAPTHSLSGLLQQPAPQPSPQEADQPSVDTGKVATSTPWATHIAEYYQLQAAAKRCLCTPWEGTDHHPWQDLAGCHRYVQAGREMQQPGVEGLANPLTHHGHYRGLQTCGSWWVCPICAAALAEYRRQEIQQALAVHRQNRGSLLFATLTLSHHHHSLGGTLNVAAAAKRRMGKREDLKHMLAELGSLGAIWVTEITWTVDHGWHPHFHILWFTDAATAGQVEALRVKLSLLWRMALEKEGASASMRCGVDVRSGDWDAEQYLTKMGHQRVWDLDKQLTEGQDRQEENGSLYPWDLLRIVAGVATFPVSTEAQATRLFQEYAAATAGHHSIRWSQGLRERLSMMPPPQDPDGMGYEEVEHQAQIPETGEFLLSFGVMPPSEWQIVLANDCVAEYRIVLGTCDYGKILGFLQSIGVGWVPYDPTGGGLRAPPL